MRSVPRAVTRKGALTARLGWLYGPDDRHVITKAEQGESRGDFQAGSRQDGLVRQPSGLLLDEERFGLLHEEHIQEQHIGLHPQERKNDEGRRYGQGCARQEAFPLGLGRAHRGE